ncbi:hypothetical protein QA942_30435 [Streptomyces sp. B21-106]|uniref:hypothetical protein n=1 Tax=Streptomyces sp. B21-106 TaxID=3039418 RepID=UPI002FF0ADBE
MSMLAEDAYTISPSPAPYPAIRQRGLAERRRRVALAGAVLATLAAVPVGAYAVAGGSGGRGSDTAATKPSASVPGGTAANPGTTGGTTTGSTGARRRAAAPPGPRGRRRTVSCWTGSPSRRRLTVWQRA